jgi:hypothetical protein
MATQYAVRMTLCIECSPAKQEVPGSIRDATFSDALCKGCRWLWSSLYRIVKRIERRNGEEEERKRRERRNLEEKDRKRKQRRNGEED